MTIPSIERVPVPPDLTATALDARLRAGEPFPIIDGVTCTFVHHGPAISVTLVHFGVGFPHDLGFTQVDEESDWWVLPLAVPAGSRIEYKLEVVDSFGTHLVEDALNQSRAAHPFGANSVLEADGYDEPAFAVAGDTGTAGRLVDFEHASTALGRSTTTTVYLPGNFTAASRHKHPLLLVHDGGDYLQYASIATVLDNLIGDGTIPPTVVALLQPAERLVEYADDPSHAEFLCDELVPTLESELPVAGTARRRFLMGASFGAVASLSAAWRRADVFGGVLLQSGSFAGAGTGCRPRPEPLWRPVRQFVRSYLAAPTAVTARVAVTCGVYESLICENRALVPELARTGMEVRFIEALDGHNWISWRDSLGLALPWLLTG